ncbi:MAG: PH domain-containing protein [Dorea sp.]|nr:PH domain-containing protein [Dorea sp.]
MADEKKTPELPVFKMREIDSDIFEDTISVFLVDGEEIICCYKAVRDYLVFTNKRMILVDVQGITGMKKEFEFIPYRNIQTFKVKTAGLVDIDMDVELQIVGHGKVHMEFASSTNAGKLVRMISGFTLK